MKFVWEVEYEHRQAIDHTLGLVVESLDIKSLQSIVVTGIEDSCYHATVQQWARKMHISTNTRSSDSGQGWGKILSNLDSNGNFKQVIVIRYPILVAAYKNLLSVANVGNGTFANESVPNGLIVFLHELGHVFDNQNIFSLTGFTSTRDEYNLRIKEDYNEYILQNALSIWGEFFAESFALKTCPIQSPTEGVQRIADGVRNYFPPYTSSRVYFIVYDFVLWLAHNYSIEPIDYTELETNIDILPYSKYLIRIGNECINLYKSYPNWKLPSAMRGIIVAYEEMLSFEQERQAI